jgi:hypothetical protein
MKNWKKFSPSLTKVCAEYINDLLKKYKITRKEAHFNFKFKLDTGIQP